MGKGKGATKGKKPARRDNRGEVVTQRRAKVEASFEEGRGGEKTGTQGKRKRGREPHFNLELEEVQRYGEAKEVEFERRNSFVKPSERPGAEETEEGKAN